MVTILIVIRITLSHVVVQDYANFLNDLFVKIITGAEGVKMDENLV